jgi:hypothetical protein
VADDPVEELFAVVDEEAAMGGVCEFEVGLLMDSVVGEVRRGGCGLAVGRLRKRYLAGVG